MAATKKKPCVRIRKLVWWSQLITSPLWTTVFQNTKIYQVNGAPVDYRLRFSDLVTASPPAASGMGQPSFFPSLFTSHSLTRHPQTLTASARNFFPYHQLASKASLIIATMASKFMVNAAFQVRLLLRPSHQRTVFRAVNTISGRPMLPLILSSRSYSESTPTPPLPKTSGSTESSQSSGPADKTYSTSTSTPPFPKSSGPTKGSQSSGPNWYHPQGWGGAPVVLVLVVRAGSFYVSFETC
jgi:hypothetical protein